MWQPGRADTKAPSDESGTLRILAASMFRAYGGKKLVPHPRCRQIVPSRPTQEFFQRSRTFSIPLARTPHRRNSSVAQRGQNHKRKKEQDIVIRAAFYLWGAVFGCTKRQFRPAGKTQDWEILSLQCIPHT